MKKIYFLFFPAILLFSSCKKFLNMPPKNTKVVYTMEDVRQAMSGLIFATTSSSAGATISRNVRYNNQYIQYPFTRALNVSSALYTNDLDFTKFTNEDIPSPARGGKSFAKEYSENKNWEGYKFSGEIWREVFNSVGYANMVLKDLASVPDYNKTDYERISGEARVLRAYYLLRLNQLFAPYDKDEFGIPFNFEADVIQGGTRWKQTELYKKLIGEIMDVLAYTTEPKASWNLFFNKKVIYAILAQTYQFKAGSCAAEADDWKKAEQYAIQARGDNGIESTKDEQTELTTLPFSVVVNKPHKFALIRFGLYASGPNDYAPWGRPEQLLLQSPSEELFNLYDATDIRRDVYFKIVDNKPYFVKFISTDAHACTDAHMLFRYSELLLIEAEAKERQNKGAGLTLLNEFKTSKIPGYTGYTGNDVLGEIFKERRKEFVLEEQMTWLDMKRIGAKVTRKAKDEATNELKDYTLEANDYRYTFPIPADYELKYNNIPQNPGWK